MNTTPQNSAAASPVFDPNEQDAAFDNVGSGATSGYGDSPNGEEDEDELGDDFAEDDMDAEDDLGVDDLAPTDDEVLAGEPLDDDIDDDLDDDL